MSSPSSASKKSFRSTLWLTIFVIAVAAYTAWEYKKAGSDNDTAQEKKLFNFTNDDVEEIKIVRPEGTLQILRDADGWKVKQPYSDLAEPTAVDAVLYSLALQKGKIFRGEDEGKVIAWKEFALDPAGIQIEIRTKKDTQKIGVSTKHAFDGSFYLRKGNDLMLGDRGMAQAVLRDPKTFRTRRVWREADAEISSVEAELNGDSTHEKFTVRREGEDWTLDPAPKFPVDKARLRLWVNNIQQIQPSEVVSETLSEAQKREFLLLKPSLVLHVNFKRANGQAGEWSLTVGQERSDDLFLHTDTLPTVYKTTKASLDLIRVTPEYFRDGKVPFHYAVEQAKSIEVKNGAFKHVFKKSDLVWKPANPSDGELDQDKLVKMMQDISTFEAEEFLPANEGKGFTPNQEILVRDDKGKMLLDLTWGENYKAKMPYNKGVTLRFVKTNLESQTMGVSTTKFGNLVDPSMLKEKAEPVKKSNAQKK